MTETPTPETFDLDAWLNDANLPEESCVVYKRGDVMSELSSLEEQIKIEQSVPAQTQTDIEKLMDLRERWEKLANVFAASKVTVFVQAVPRSKVRAIDEKIDKDTKKHKWTPKDARIEFGYALISEAVIGLQPVGEERFPVKFSRADARRLEDKIGSGQFGAIMQAKTRADSALVEPNADFLQKPSGDSKDDIDV